MDNVLGKIVSSQEILRNILRCQQKSIVLTTGVFDVLHLGHLKYLSTARDMGDLLVVGINNDEFTRKLKGPGRPIHDEQSRAMLIAGFGCVDYVHIFSDRIQIIDTVQPQVFVMSETSHAKPETRLEQQDRVRKYGGEVVILGAFSNIHSTDIIKMAGCRN